MSMYIFISSNMFVFFINVILYNVIILSYKNIWFLNIYNIYVNSVKLGENEL